MRNSVNRHHGLGANGTTGLLGSPYERLPQRDTGAVWSSSSTALAAPLAGRTPGGLDAPGRRFSSILASRREPSLRTVVATPCGSPLTATSLLAERRAIPSDRKSNSVRVRRSF